MNKSRELGLAQQLDEILNYRSQELALQERVLQQFEQFLCNDSLPPSAVYETSIRLDQSKAIILLYNIMMNNHVHSFIREDREKNPVK